MADNVLITQGSGTTIAADDIGGVLHQRVKLSQGADGSATDVSSAAPLQVTLANTGANATPLVVDLGANNDVSINAGTNYIGKVRLTDGTTDGEVVPLAGYNAQAVAIVDASGDQITSFGGGVQYTEGDTDASFTGTVSLAEGPGNTAAAMQVDASGHLQIDIAAASTSLTVSDGGGSITVDNNGTFAVQATLQSNSGVDVGDVTINNASGGSAVNIQDGGNSITVDGTVSATSAGDVAHDSADSGNPVKVGGKAVSSEPTAVANADRANLITDLVGKLITLPYANPENFVSGAITSSMTGTTSTSLVAAPGSGLRNYITTIIVSNAHATVGTDVAIQDGSGGTTLLTIPAAAVYGGAVINLPVPLRQPTTNTALFCANVTTGASTKVSAVGYKGV